MTFGEVNALVHPDDLKLYELAAELCRRQGPSVDHAFRMRHANGNWVWLRARCELVRQPGEPGAPDRHRRRHHRAEDAGREDRRRRPAPARRDRDDPGSLRGVGRRQPPRAVQLELPGAAQPPRRGDRGRAPPTSVVAAGRKPVVRTKASTAASVPGARTFEAQLDDGRWLHISERRTKDGGYVSVGTDITALKRHEEKLMDSEKRLMATVADLRRSQQTLGAADRGACRTGREIRRRKDPRRGSQPGEIEIPRQYEPRAAHAAQRHHRLFRDHGIGDVRPARRRQNIANIAATSARAANICSTSSTTFSTCRRSRPAASGSDFEDLELDRFLADAMRVVSGARQGQGNLTLVRRIAGIRLHADRRALKQIALNLLSNAVKFTPEGGRVTVRGRAARRRHHRHRRYRHRHSQGRAGQARAGRSSRWKASSPRAIRARGSASPSRNRSPSCTAARCASAPRSASARRWCVCRSKRLPREGTMCPGAMPARRNS